MRALILVDGAALAVSSLSTQSGANPMPDSPPFELQGPDEQGHAWICSAKSDPNAWCHNLGPYEAAVEVLSQWLAERDRDEVEDRGDANVVKVKRTIIGGRDE